jgi:hypothetical protein
LRRAALRLAATLAGALALVACGGSGGPDEAAPPPPPGAAGALTDIENVLDVRAAFNRDAGVPRLLLLLSPT